MSSTSQQRRFAAAAWTFLGYLILVILLGAWVRISFSGAGCGDHWPTCHGQLVPDTSDQKTWIEFSHRVTSGLAGLLGLGLFGWAWRRFERGHRALKAAGATVFFLITESLIGAILVKGGFVEHDDSVGRALVIALHLVNTLGLTGAAALMAWWGSGGRAPSWTGKRRLEWLLGLALGGLVITSMAGAVTALGDTLFPTDPTLGSGLLDKIRGDVSASSHFLIRLRIIHPVLSVAIGIYTMVVAAIIAAGDVDTTTRRLAWGTFSLVVVQLVVGIANIWLGAPGWMQLTHLALAQGLWLAGLVLGAEALSTHSPSNPHASG
jgi:heme A synthase